MQRSNPAGYDDAPVVNVEDEHTMRVPPGLAPLLIIDQLWKSDLQPNAVGPTIRFRMWSVL